MNKKICAYLSLDDLYFLASKTVFYIHLDYYNKYNMIDPKELRIGNYVNLALLYSDISQEAELHAFKLVSLIKGEIIAEPIPITEEWYINFGIQDAYLGNAPLCTKEKGLFTTGVIDLRKIKYVHQLQNLYFALTGEELSLKN